MPELTDTQAVIDVAQEAVGPVGIHPGIWVVRDGYSVKDLTEILRSHADAPHRKTGSYITYHAQSFCEYLSKHTLPETEVWVDVTAHTVTAVINAHTGGMAAGWGDHRVVLTLRKSPAWKRWMEGDRKFLTQNDFAELVEERLVDFVEPSGATMLELAQTFKATTSVGFESSKRLKSGETTIEYRETTEATAGKKGQIAIPDTFTLALPPFDLGPHFKVPARLRYRIRDGHLSLGYVIERPEDILREAFGDAVGSVRGGIDVPIWEGSPPPAR